MIDRASKLPVTAQCRLLQVARSTVYYQPRPVGERDLELMRRIDEICSGRFWAGASSTPWLTRASAWAASTCSV